MKRFFTAFLVASSLILQLGFFSCTTKPSDYTVLLDSVAVDSVCPLFHNYEKPACHFSLNMEVPYIENNTALSQSLERFLAAIPRQGAFAGDGELPPSGRRVQHVHDARRDDRRPLLPSRGRGQRAARHVRREQPLPGLHDDVREERRDGRGLDEVRRHEARDGDDRARSERGERRLDERDDGRRVGERGELER